MGKESVDRETELNNQKMAEEIIDTRKRTSFVDNGKTAPAKTDENMTTTITKEKGPRMEGSAFMQKQAQGDSLCAVTESDLQASPREPLLEKREESP